MKQCSEDFVSKLEIDGSVLSLLFPQVDRHQQLVESLQENLASSQGLCDGLQHEVSRLISGLV